MDPFHLVFKVFEVKQFLTIGSSFYRLNIPCYFTFLSIIWLQISASSCSISTFNFPLKVYFTDIPGLTYSTPRDKNQLQSYLSRKLS